MLRKLPQKGQGFKAILGYIARMFKTNKAKRKRNQQLVFKLTPFEQLLAFCNKENGE